MNRLAWTVKKRRNLVAILNINIGSHFAIDSSFEHQIEHFLFTTLLSSYLVKALEPIYEAPCLYVLKLS